MHCRIRSHKRQLSGLVGCLPHHHHLVGERGEHLAGIGDAIHLVSRFGHSPGDVQLPVVALIAIVPWKSELQLSRRLKTSVRCDFLVIMALLASFSASFLLSFKNQTTDFEERGHRLEVVVPVWPARPQGTFIELNGFSGNIPIKPSLPTCRYQQAVHSPRILRKVYHTKVSKVVWSVQSRLWCAPAKTRQKSHRIFELCAYNDRILRRFARQAKIFPVHGLIQCICFRRHQTAP